MRIRKSSFIVYHANEHTTIENEVTVLTSITVLVYTAAEFTDFKLINNSFERSVIYGVKLIEKCFPFDMAGHFIFIISRLIAKID